MCLAVVWSWPSAVAAQTTRPAVGPLAAEEPWEVRVAATEQVLWVARVAPSGSRLYQRGVSGQFGPGRRSNGRIDSLTAAENSAYVFFDDNRLYRYFADDEEPAPLHNLPERRGVVNMVAAGGGVLYALVDSQTARALTPLPPAEEPGAPPTPASHPFDPGSAALAVVAYSKGDTGQQWLPLVACPAAVQPTWSPRLHPRLALLRGELLLFWTDPAEPDRIHYVRLDGAKLEWRLGGTLGLPQLVGFWPVQINRVFTVAVSIARPDLGTERLAAFRLLGDGRDEWRPAELSLALPAGGAVKRVAEVLGFNQHLGALLFDPQDEPYLCFTRIGGTAAEPSLRVADIFIEKRPGLRDSNALHLAMLLLLALVFTALFVFRRRSMVTLVALPRQYELAFTFQRVAALAVDLVPFTLLGAVLWGVRWADGFRALTAWALGTDSAGSGLPELRVLGWWAASVGSYTTYSLIMELLTRRTVGKLLLGTRPLSESGDRPTRRQVLTRNLLRLVELLPPMWALGFLAVLTRNRQRLGDIFARTVVVRAAKRSGGEKTPDPGGTPEPPAPPDDSPAEPPEQARDDDPSGRCSALAGHQAECVKPSSRPHAALRPARRHPRH